MLDHNSLQQLRRDVRVPDTLRIDHHNWPTGADAKTWRLAALHAARTEEQVLALEQRRELRVNRTTTAIGRTEAADAHNDVAHIRLHERLGRIHRLDSVAGSEDVIFNQCSRQLPSVASRC